jgi:hypothetical protein
MGITLVKIKCPYCQEPAKKELGDVNRAKKIGVPIYCSRKCSGLARRTGETEEQKKMIKYFYDRLIYLSDDGTLKKKKQAYFKRDYAANPDKYRKERKRRQPAHNEYCRRPEYRSKKKVYDQQYRDAKNYGAYAEAATALRELANIVDNRQAKSEQKIFNKSQKRKRYAKQQFKRQEL